MWKEDSLSSLHSHFVERELQSEKDLSKGRGNKNLYAREKGLGSQITREKNIVKSSRDFFHINIFHARVLFYLPIKEPVVQYRNSR